jgi:hypothetical protein
MGESEVRSPNSLARDQYQPRRGESPGSRSSPSNARSDDHINPHAGKGWTPVSRRDANQPVQGAYRSPYDPRD